jgi:hypothetical protein
MEENLFRRQRGKLPHSVAFALALSLALAGSLDRLELASFHPVCYVLLPPSCKLLNGTAKEDSFALQNANRATR